MKILSKFMITVSMFHSFQPAMSGELASLQADSLAAARRSFERQAAIEHVLRTPELAAPIRHQILGPAFSLKKMMRNTKKLDITVNPFIEGGQLVNFHVQSHENDDAVCDFEVRVHYINQVEGQENLDLGSRIVHLRASRIPANELSLHLEDGLEHAALLRAGYENPVISDIDESTLSVHCSSLNPYEFDIKPDLSFIGSEEYTVRGNDFIRFRLGVDNFEYFPEEIFEAAPDLPACGLNENSSRSWISIFNADNHKRLYGFCNFRSVSSLERLWFAVRKSEWQENRKPSRVYIEITDRRASRTFRSQTISVGH